ncbi:hypothetical protein BDZ89DRAFT_609845 [Hymenopellis radicata]|nr:hypothetical protein BDZ89DRAFT_609845 [Hymenopellis radicata]
MTVVAVEHVGKGGGRGQRVYSSSIGNQKIIQLPQVDPKKASAAIAIGRDLQPGPLCYARNFIQTVNPVIELVYLLLFFSLGIIRRLDSAGLVFITV